MHLLLALVLATAMRPTVLRGVITLSVVKQSAPLIRSAVTTRGTISAPKKQQISAATAAMQPLATAANLMALQAVMMQLAARAFVQSIHSAAIAHGMESVQVKLLIFALSVMEAEMNALTQVTQNLLKA